MGKHLCANCKRGSLKFDHSVPVTKTKVFKKKGKVIKKKVTYRDNYFRCNECNALLKCIKLPSYEDWFGKRESEQNE